MIRYAAKLTVTSPLRQGTSASRIADRAEMRYSTTRRAWLVRAPQCAVTVENYAPAGSVGSGI